MKACRRNFVLTLPLAMWVGYGIASLLWRDEGYIAVAIHDVAYLAESSPSHYMPVTDLMPQQRPDVLYYTNASPADSALFLVFLGFSVFGIVVHLLLTARSQRAED